MPRKKKELMDPNTPDAAPLASPAPPDVPPDVPHIVVRERGMSAQEIIERRLALGDAAVLTSAKVTLKPQNEPMETRWINTHIAGRFYQVTAQMGWTPVPYDQVENAKQTADLKKSEEGYACRGEKGAEVLVMMPARYYTAIQAKKAADERGRMRSAKMLKEITQNQLGNEGQHRVADRLGKMTLDAYSETVERNEIQR